MAIIESSLSPTPHIIFERSYADACARNWQLAAMGNWRGQIPLVSCAALSIHSHIENIRDLEAQGQRQPGRRIRQPSAQLFDQFCNIT